MALGTEGSRETKLLEQSHGHTTWQREGIVRTSFQSFCLFLCEPISVTCLQLLLNNMLEEFPLASGCRLDGRLSHVPYVACNTLLVLTPMQGISA